MRALIRGRRGDPAPSRLSYRLTRFWLSPLARRLVLVVLPAALLAAALAWHLTRAETQAQMGAAFDQLREGIEARPEFRVRQMKITGASPELAQAIRDRLDIDFPTSWFDIRAADLRDSVAALDAVQAVSIEVELGGALSIAVTERTPAALWRHAGGLEIVDGGGHRIAFIDRRDGRPDLPLLTGAGATRAVPEALALMRAAEPLGDRVIALTRMGERRWDLRLDRDQVVKLPAHDPRAALDRVLAMDRATDLLARDVAVVDMRLPRRPTVRLGPDAVDYLRTTRAFQEGLATR